MVHKKKSLKKQEGSFFLGRCDSCNEIKQLSNVGHLNLCHSCEEEFLEPLFKKLSDDQFGKNHISDLDKKTKKNNSSKKK